MRVERWTLPVFHARLRGLLFSKRLLTLEKLPAAAESLAAKFLDIRTPRPDRDLTTSLRKERDQE
jgi:hypothetical protein